MGVRVVLSLTPIFRASLVANGGGLDRVDRSQRARQRGNGLAPLCERRFGHIKRVAIADHKITREENAIGFSEIQDIGHALWTGQIVAIEDDLRNR